MRAGLALLMVAAVTFLGGCQASASANPYAGLPSNACGGFHLKVVNQTRGSVRVELNGTWTTVVPANTTQVINESFSTPRPPQPPWQVVISDESTRSQLFTATMPGPVDQKVTLSADGPVQTPYDLREDC